MRLAQQFVIALKHIDEDDVEVGVGEGGQGRGLPGICAADDGSFWIGGKQARAHGDEVLHPRIEGGDEAAAIDFVKHHGHRTKVVVVESQSQGQLLLHSIDAGLGQFIEGAKGFGVEDFVDGVGGTASAEQDGSALAVAAQAEQHIAGEAWRSDGDFERMAPFVG